MWGCAWDLYRYDLGLGSVLGSCNHFYEASDTIQAGNSLSVSVIIEELICSTDIFVLRMYSTHSLIIACL